MIRAALVLLVGMISAAPTMADDFVCPVQPETGSSASDTEKAPEISANEPLDSEEQLGTMVAMLRSKGVSPTLIVDNLMASYCPRVAASGLPTSQKTALMRSFATRVTRIVYAPSDKDEVAVLLDIPLPPDLEKQAAAAAKREGSTVQEWIVEAVRQRLQR